MKLGERNCCGNLYHSAALSECTKNMSKSANHAIGSSDILSGRNTSYACCYDSRVMVYQRESRPPISRYVYKGM